jgi:hypothetical protein
VRYILAALLVLGCIGYVVHVEQRLDEIRSHVMGEPGVLYHSHYSVGVPPVLREVKTTRAHGESVADWKARHRAAVDALLEQYPPI